MADETGLANNPLAARLLAAQWTRQQGGRRGWA